MAAAKRKAGRPVGSGEGLTAKATITLSPALKEQVDAAARRAGQRPAEWWRCAAHARLGGVSGA